MKIKKMIIITLVLLVLLSNIVTFADRNPDLKNDWETILFANGFVELQFDGFIMEDKQIIKARFYHNHTEIVFNWYDDYKNLALDYETSNFYYSLEYDWLFIFDSEMNLTSNNDGF